MADTRQVLSGASGIVINTDGTVTPTYGSTSHTVTQGNDSRLSITQVVNVKLNPGSGEFSDLQLAIDSITDNSSSKRYSIECGPGDYIGNFILKPYIDLRGSGQEATNLIAAVDTLPVITGVPASSIGDCRIHGSTGTGGIGAYLLGGATYPLAGIPFVVRDCLFGHNETQVKLDGNSKLAIMFVEGCLLSSEFAMGFHCSTPGTRDAVLTISNTTFSFGSATPPDFIFVSGPTAQLIINGVIALNNGGLGHALHIENGASVTTSSCSFEGFDTGIHIANVGTAPQINLLGCFADNTSYDLKIDHPGTTGTVTGALNSTKVLCASAGVSLTFTDTSHPTTNRGTVVIGDLIQGDSVSTLYNSTSLIRFTSTLGLLYGGQLTDGGGLNVNVAAGFGFLELIADDSTREITWGSTSIPVPANSTRYIYFNEASVLSLSATIPNARNAIILGRVRTLSAGIEFLNKTPVSAYHYGNQNQDRQRELYSSLYSSGSVVSEVGTRQLNVSGGVYYFMTNRFVPLGANPITFTDYYQSATPGVWTRVTGQTSIDNLYWDNATGTLAPLGTGKLVKHTLYVMGSGADTQYMRVYGQVQFDNIALAEAGPLPLPPTYFSENITKIAAILVEEGVATLRVYDERATLGSQAATLSATATHGNLLGLDADDHAQYLLVNGTRAMAGTLDMATNLLTNVGTINGVTVETHASRHLIGGGDTIASGSGLEITDATNDAGVDNTHISYAGHHHAHGSRGGGTLHAAVTTSVNGFMSSSDKTKLDGVQASAVALTTNTPQTISDSTNTLGTGTASAKDDHVHSHGSRGGSSLHTVATTSVAGFESATDKTKLDSIPKMKSGVVTAASFTGNPRKATVTFATAFPDANYSIVPLGGNGRQWTYESKVAGSVVLNANAGAALTVDVLWIAMAYGESS